MNVLAECIFDFYKEYIESNILHHKVILLQLHITLSNSFYITYYILKVIYYVTKLQSYPQIWVPLIKIYKGC